MNPSKKCLICGVEIFRNTVRKDRWEKTTCCSFEHWNQWRKGKKLTGRRLEIQRLAQLKMIASITPEMREKMNKRILKTRKLGTWYPHMQGKKAEKCPNWLGEKAGYNGKHRWIQQNWIKTGICEECGKSPISKGRNKFATQWSSNDHLYKRIREEWQELCQSCHIRKDKQLRFNNK